MTTSVENYQGLTDDLAGETAAAVLTVYAAYLAGRAGPNAAAEAIAAVIATANAAATTLADLFVAAQVERATGKPQPPTGIAPRDDSERLTKAVATVLDDLDDAEDVDDVPVEDTDAEPEADEDRAAADDDEDRAEDETTPEDTAAMRLERLARSEPLDTGQAITVEIVNRLPQVTGWRRVLDADPCERCTRWAEDGRVFPKGHHFKRHFNCNCQMEVVTTEGKSA
ncbi:hypothetical protein [Mycobacterium sp. 236(2023)]|uniref:hypothetical protein n=1 Tax=Mycobacterium sp. 236(2023) TaxID=3038163 RepID=UPI002415968E|nr:hypothetical protein [Mycobacterium sp. 236(2023)]MDG4667814.1 hypothetical protein [Mycobacterium sp. 236(2023)]